MYQVLEQVPSWREREGGLGQGGWLLEVCIVSSGDAALDLGHM